MAFCVLSAIPSAVAWSTIGTFSNGGTASDWLLGIVSLSLVGMVICFVAALVFGVPLVVGLSRFGLANMFSVTVPGLLMGFAVYFLWIVNPPLIDGHGSLESIVADTVDVLFGFCLCGGIAAAAFWLGARPR